MAAGDRDRPTESSSNLAYDPAEREEIEAEIARLELLVIEIRHRAACSSDPGDYFDYSDKCQDLATLYARKYSCIDSELIRREAILAGGPVVQPEHPRPAETDSSGEVVQQQEIGIGNSSNQSQEEDDWEAFFDNEASLADLSLSSPSENTALSGSSTENGLYSDQVVDAALVDHDSEVHDPGINSSQEESGTLRNHWEGLSDNVVSLADLSLSSPPENTVLSEPPTENGLYSDQVVDAASVDRDSEVHDPGINSSQEEHGTLRNQRYDTSHVLLLSDFPPTTQTTHLESVFENFSEGDLAIRRVSDIVALAVFRTPYAADEAQTSIEFPFNVRRLEEGDIALHKIPWEDLEPPTERPMTSERAAQI